VNKLATFRQCSVGGIAQWIPRLSFGDAIALTRRFSDISCRIRWPYALGKLRALLPLNHADVVLALQVQPELRAVAEARRAD